MKRWKMRELLEEPPSFVLARCVVVVEIREIIASEGEAGNSRYLTRSGQTMVRKGDLQTPKFLGRRGRVA